MLTSIHPKLPMRDKNITRDYYISQLDFRETGNADYDDYLILEKDQVQIHFFSFKELEPDKNYGQVYIRTDEIDRYYQSLLDHKVRIYPGCRLERKPWGQKEFSLLDPDKNLLTFGMSL
jgi:hypothetical protein